MNSLDQLETKIRKLLKGNNFRHNNNLTAQIKAELEIISLQRGYSKRQGIRNFTRSKRMQSSKANINEYITNIRSINETISTDAVMENILPPRNDYLDEITYTIRQNKTIEFTNMSLREYLGVIYLKKLKDTLERNADRMVYLDVYANDPTIAAIGSSAMRASSINLEFICTKFSTEELYAQLDLVSLNVFLKIRKHVGNGKVENIKELFNMEKGIHELDVEEYCGQACLFVALNAHRKNFTSRLTNIQLLEHAKALAKTFCDKPSMDVIDFDLFKQKPVKVVTYNDNEFKICGEFNQNKDKSLYILLHNNHYYLVTQINKLLEYNDSIMCKKCNDIHLKKEKCKPFKCSCDKEYKTLKGYNEHRAVVIDIKCDDCNIILMYEGCRNHKCENKNKKTLISCKLCSTGFNTKNRYEEHLKNGCRYERKCNNCLEFYHSNKSHFCYLNPIHSKDPMKAVYLYDIECYKQPDGIQKFAMAYIMALDSDETIFIDSEEKMLDFITDNKETKILYAHNGSKYDNFIVLESLVRNSIKVNDNVIMTGRSPIQFSVNKITFRDSFLLFNVPLRDLPKMFGLPDIKKTVFPYEALTLNNKNLKITSDMSHQLFNADDLPYAEDFIKENKDKYLVEVCKTYCYNDVIILKQAIFKYREVMVDICKVLCVNSFKLLTKKYDINPTKEEIDKICLKLKHEDRINSICKKYNLIDKSSDRKHLANVILEYYGHSYTNPLSSLTKAAFSYKIFAKYNLKPNLISYIPYATDKFIREGFYGGKTCNISRFQEKYPDSDKKITADDISSSYPACQLFNYMPTRFLEHKKLVKIDYRLPENKNTSMALSIIEYEENKANFNACHAFIHGTYNIGRCGFFRCDIEVPNLIHPSLPSIIDNGRLADTCYNIIDGVHNTPELLLAIKRGYKITKISEYALFERSTCIQIKAPVFGEEIKKLIKSDYVKQYQGFFNYRTEKDGIIKTTTSDEIDKIINNIYEIVEYRLYDEDDWIFGDIITVLYNKKNSIEKAKNPGMYNCIKILLNSIWGKMGEKYHPENTSFYTGKDVAKYIKLLIKERKKHVIMNSEIAIGTGIVCKYTNVDKDHTSPKSIALAAYTTGWGRIRLYEGIDHYDDETLYFDTDSTFAYSSKGVPVSGIGYIAGGLGSWEREEDDIEEYYSTAPKAYSLKRVKPLKGEIYKIASKGIPVRASTKIMVGDVEESFTKELAHKINKKMVLEDIPNYNITMLQFRRDKFMQIKVDNNFVKQVNYNSNTHSDNKRVYFREEQEGKRISFSLPLGYAY